MEFSVKPVSQIYDGNSVRFRTKGFGCVISGIPLAFPKVINWAGESGRVTGVDVYASVCHDRKTFRYEGPREETSGAALFVREHKAGDARFDAVVRAGAGSRGLERHADDDSAGALEGGRSDARTIGRNADHGHHEPYADAGDHAPTTVGCRAA